MSVEDSFWVMELVFLSAPGPHVLQSSEGLVHYFLSSEFSCALVLLCLEGLVSLVSFIPSGSYHLSVSSSMGFPDL